MTRTLSSTYASLVTLSGTADNPTTITSQGLLNAGLYGDSLSTDWMITNAGKVLGAGITLASAGTVVNAGSIMGDTASSSDRGLVLQAGGSVINERAGSISGFDGIYGTNAAVSVMNLGSIAGNSSSGVGVYLRAAGNITNQSSASISGEYGVAGRDATTVVNAGDIVGYSSHGGGVRFDASGNVTNLSGGSIAGYNGIQGFVAPVTVVNAGNIAANETRGTGIQLYAGGTVTNQSDGTISGVAAIFGDGVTVTNAGIIAGDDSVGVGVYARGGSYVANEVSAAISGFNGIYAKDSIDLADLTVVNAGSITGNATSGTGILLDAVGDITNQAGGLISGYKGIYGSLDTDQSVTIINAGTIIGNKYAVLFSAGPSNLLVIDPGAVFSGMVDGGNATAVSTLELASAASAGTLSGLGAKYINFAQTTIDAGASWTLTGANTIVTGATLTELSNASVIDTGTLVNNGAIVLDPSTLTVADLTGTGSVAIDAGSTLNAQGTVADTETISFAGSGAYLHLGAPDSASGSVTNFAIGETIDLKGIDPNSVTYASGSTLHFSGGSFPLALASGGTVTATPSGDGAAVSLLCFCADTQILTPSGERPVQQLAIGDMVTTHRGEARRIAWIGKGSVLATRGRRNAATPVIVRKGALADNVPSRDLRISKGHSLYLDDVLIPVEFLINHRSILWDDRAQEVTLYHVELATHDVLVANHAPAESYRDDGNRWLFQNASPGWGLPAQEPCAPVVTGGPVVDAVWRRLLDRSGPRPGLVLTDDPDLHIVVDGNRLDAVGNHAGAHIFRLRSRPVSVRIASRAAAPAELGVARDPRVLGVAVRQIALRKGRRLRIIASADGSLSDGFYSFEPANGLRWTNGDAGLPTVLFADFDGPMELVLHIGSTTRYPLWGQSDMRVAA